MIHLKSHDSSDIKSGDYVEFECDVCGYHGKIRYDHYLNGIGCGACNGKKVHKGFNDLWTTAPDIAARLNDCGQGYQLTKCSTVKPEFRCPYCDQLYHARVVDEFKRGVRCPYCRLGVSYPNRVMMTLLSELQVDFVNEASFPWSERKRYDFFIKPDIIVEMHGGQHYHGFYGSTTGFPEVDEIVANDNHKKSIALNNGISKYIVIDASESSISYISQSIVKSEFADIFDISGINWAQIDQISRTRIFDDVVQRYKSGATPSEIANALHISNETVRKHLKLATEYGQISYSPHDSVLQCQRLAAEGRKRPVRCITTGMCFGSLAEAAEFYHIGPKTLSSCLVGRTSSSGRLDGVKLKWEYIDKEKYYGINYSPLRQRCRCDNRVNPYMWGVAQAANGGTLGIQTIPCQAYAFGVGRCNDYSERKYIRRETRRWKRPTSQLKYRLR